VSYLETNAAGTLNVLEVARALGTSRVIATSTSEVYGTAQRVPMDELHHCTRSRRTRLRRSPLTSSSRVTT